jgi:hypothetical protein
MGMLRRTHRLRWRNVRERMWGGGTDAALRARTARGAHVGAGGQASRSCGFGGPVEGSSRDGAGGLGSGVSARLPKAKNRLIWPLMMPVIVPIGADRQVELATECAVEVTGRDAEISADIGDDGHLWGGSAPRRRLRWLWAGAQGADLGWAGVLGATGGEGRGPRRMEGADVAGEHLHDQRARCAGAAHVWTPRV